MRNQVFKKLFSVLLALIMVAGLLPASVLAEGEGNAETTPAPTETVQPTESAEPTEPDETETPEVTEVPEPTPENPATTDEPAADPTEEITIPLIPTNGEGNVAVQAATEKISYVTKDGEGVPLYTPDGMFYRIVHLDCGRKYFSEAQIKQIIDYAYNYGYTHVELAFGNEGLRFLLDDMGVTANGKTYASEAVTSAIQAGNKDFYNAGTNELSQEEMNRIIAYAQGKGIGIIPMFDAPGHLQTVIRAMNSDTLGMSVNYSRPTTSGTSENWALDPTDVAGVNFVQALMQKYITYFKDKGCTMFNIAADECGFTSMSDDTYTAYAKLVNSMAAMVQNAGMTALAFNDGIYHIGLTLESGVEFDTNIAVCYWDATTNKYAPAATLAGKGFKIINTNNKWYYAVGYTGSSTWYAYDWVLSNINGQYSNCKNADGNYITDVGCMLAIWCDRPGNTYEADKVENLMKALQTQNKGDFVQVEAPKTPAVTIDATVTDNAKAEPTKNENEYTVTVKANGSSTIQLKAENMGDSVTWESDNTKVATVDKTTGKVTFTGTAGTVIITAEPVATKGGTTTAYSITLNVEVEGEVKLEERKITVTVGGTATDVIEGYNYSSADQKDGPDESIATVESVVGTDAASKRELGNQQTPNSGSTNSSYKGVFSDGTNYLIMTAEGVSNTTDVNNATVFTVKIIGSNSNSNDKKISISTEINGSTYYLSYSNATNGTFSVTTTAPTTSANFWQCGSENDFFTSAGWSNGVKRYLSCNNGDWTPAGTSGTAKLYAINETGTKKQTIVTFNGVAVGTTYVTIGHVKYTINVIKENLDNVAALPVQLWITNNGIQVDNKTQKTSGSFGNDRYAFYASIKAEDAYYEEGKPLSELIPASISGLKEWGNVYWDKTAQDADIVSIVGDNSHYMGKDSNGDFKARAEWTLDLYRGMLHTSGNFQTNYVDSVNRTESGTEFHYVRYFDKKWEVSADRIAWVELKDWSITTGTCTSYSYNSSSTQIVAYYMAQTDVTKEVTTDVVDWGNAKPTSSSQVILDYAVKYPDGTRKPKSEEFPIDGKTMYFNMLSNGDTVRRIYDIKALETDKREVYMITVTPSSDKSSDKISITNGQHPTYSYAGTEMVAWVDDEANLPPEFRDTSRQYTSINGKITYTVGGEPTIKGVEIYKNQAMLVTYYLRDKVTKDTLYVHYIDKTANKQFHEYYITVAENTFFKDGIGLGNPWKGPLVNGTVVNDVNATITVSADLSTMPEIGAQYRYATNYKCTLVTHSEDKKHVYLYYEFKSSVTFVVDFGLPLKITPEKVSSELANADITGVQIKQDTYYADITSDSEHNIVYKLTQMISGEDNFQVVYKGVNHTTNQEGTATYTVTIIPATNVYYEDSFAKFTDGSYVDGENNTAIGWITEEKGTVQNANTTQALETLGQANHNPYGYDPAYDNCTMFSMGSAHKVTVTNNMAKDGVVWPTAQFTFKGTGFDIISLTDNTSGAIFVDVYNTETGKNEKSVFVDNYYGYTYNSKTNTWDATPEKNNVLYQIPVIALRNLPYAEYNVVIKVAYSEYFDHTATPGSYSFWLDAVRVYDPMGVDNDIYNTENEKEGFPQYIKLRDAVANKDATLDGSKALFIDGGNTADIATYANLGPNNEVYLAKGQAITFKLEGDLSKIATIQIGAKAPMGSANLVVNSVEAKVLGTATEMYYTLDKNENNQFTISNTDESGILSLTNLKITFTSKPGTEVTLAKLNETEQQDAVATVRALFAPAPVEPEPEPEPEKTFEPDRFEASWSRNVMQGRKATLTVKTSEDVEAITVDGQTIRSYRTRTERVGFGRYAKRVTYREFTYSMVAQETADFSVTAINAEGIESEAITARLTVQKRPGSIRDVWNWFKGWF